MLRDLLAAFASSPTASTLEIRSRLQLDRLSYEQLLAHLMRLGYVQEVADSAGACAPDSCHGCTLRCAAQAPTGRPLAVTARGRAFLQRPG